MQTVLFVTKLSHLTLVGSVRYVRALCGLKECMAFPQPPMDCEGPHAVLGVMHAQTYTQLRICTLTTLACSQHQ